MMTRIPSATAAPAREDLFGPPPEPLRRPDLRTVRWALARLLLSLATPEPGGGDPIAALRAEIDAASRREGPRPHLHPLLEPCLPGDDAAAPTLAELALLVESLAAAAPPERAARGRRLLGRCGSSVVEEVVRLIEAGEATAPHPRATEAEILAALAGAPAQIPPARVRARLALAALAAPAGRATLPAAA